MFLRIVTLQARQNWAIAMLIVLAMISLVTLYVYSSNTTQYANRSMQLVMKNMGHNLLIVPEEAEPSSVYLCSDTQINFADDTTQRMSQSLGLCSKYYVSVLQERVEVKGQEVILTGIEPVARPDESAEKGNMISPIEMNEARLGHEAARILDRDVGDSLDVLGATLRIIDILPPKATLDDCRIYVNLALCQELLNKEGQVNHILAFLCLHGGSLDRALEIQEQQLAERFPGFRQISRMDVAQGRYLARLTTQKSLYYLLGLVTTATIVIIAVTGLQEVNARKHETGIMIAMGASQSYIICLYLAKTLVLALIAAFAGFLMGSLLAVRLTAPFLVVNTQPVTVLWQHLPAVVGLTCMVAVVAEIAPILKLLTLDPNTILTEQ